MKKIFHALLMVSLVLGLLVPTTTTSAAMNSSKHFEVRDSRGSLYEVDAVYSSFRITQDGVTIKSVPAKGTVEQIIRVDLTNSFMYIDYDYKTTSGTLARSTVTVDIVDTRAPAAPRVTLLSTDLLTHEDRVRIDFPTDTVFLVLDINGVKDTVYVKGQLYFILTLKPGDVLKVQTQDHYENASNPMTYTNTTKSISKEPLLTGTVDDNINLSWDAVPYATSYEVYKDNVLVQTFEMGEYDYTYTAPYVEKNQHNFSVAKVGTTNDLMSNISAVSLNGKIYKYGGFTSSKIASIDKNGLYTTLSSSGYPGYDIAITTYNGKIYAFGGNQYGGTVTNNAEVYNPADNTVSKIAVMPVARDGAEAIAISDKIYVFGGSNGNNTRVDVYDPATDTWQGNVTTIPSGHEAFGLTELNGEIYLIGGRSNTGYKSVDIYNPTENTWRKGPDLPNGRYHLEAVTQDNRIYAVGGENETGTSSLIEMYNPNTNKWTTVGNMASPKGRFGIGKIDDKFYTVGGWTSDGAWSGEFDSIKFDTITPTQYKVVAKNSVSSTEVTFTAQ